MPTTWAGDYTGTTTATWVSWTQTTTSATSNNYDVWPAWSSTTGTSYTTNYTVVNSAPPAYEPPTPEQQARWKEQREREEREAAEARARAKALLAAHLSSEQIASLAAQRYFEVVSQRGRRYRIRHGHAGNVTRLDGEREVARYCIHPTLDVPDEDAMLAQKLMLEACEDHFERIANVTQLR